MCDMAELVHCASCAMATSIIDEQLHSLGHFLKLWWCDPVPSCQFQSNNYDAIRRATATGKYWIRNQGEDGYVNGEILNSHVNNEDHAGAVIMKESAFFKEVLKVGYGIAPFVKKWDRGFVNVRRPKDIITGREHGRHHFHMDTRHSTLILSYRLNYVGDGPAGSIVYGMGQNPSPSERLEIPMQHGDVGVYTGELHHETTADNIHHEVPSNPSPSVTQVTVMLETREPVPAGFIESLKSRMPFPPRDPITAAGFLPLPLLPHMVIPAKQIEKGSFQRFTHAETSLGGKCGPGSGVTRHDYSDGSTHTDTDTHRHTQTHTHTHTHTQSVR